MVSGDFCHHDWPGSGCSECKAEAEASKLAREPELDQLVFNEAVLTREQARDLSHEIGRQISNGITAREWMHPREDHINAVMMLAKAIFAKASCLRSRYGIIIENVGQQ